MRWLTFATEGRASFGYLTSDGEGIVDVGRRGEYADLKAAIAADVLVSLPAALGDQADVKLADIEYLPTIPNPDKILCVGLNYKAHQEETGRGGEAYPTIFVRFAGAQIGHEQPMVRPHESATLDYEGEIIDYDLPKSMEFEVVEAENAVAGDTATGATKDVVTDTGLKVRTPLFVQVGDFIKVNTESGSYITRV